LWVKQVQGFRNNAIFAVARDQQHSTGDLMAAILARKHFRHAP